MSAVHRLFALAATLIFVKACGGGGSSPPPTVDVPSTPPPCCSPPPAPPQQTMAPWFDPSVTAPGVYIVADQYDFAMHSVVIDIEGASTWVTGQEYMLLRESGERQPHRLSGVMQPSFDGYYEGTLLGSAIVLSVVGDTISGQAASGCIFAGRFHDPFQNYEHDHDFWFLDAVASCAGNGALMWGKVMFVEGAEGQLTLLGAANNGGEPGLGDRISFRVTGPM